MPGSRPIVFLTDFGGDGFYAGVLRAVAASLSPASPLIDLSHDIRAHDIRLASFVLSLSLDYLPHDAVVVAVVDPGVGGARRGLLVTIGTRAIVAPDNGLLSDVLARVPDVRIIAIAEEASTRVTGASVRGATFHGRDIFVPVAAAVARGAGPDEFGIDAGGIETLHGVPSVSVQPGPPGDSGRVTGTGRLIDRFGNILSDIPGTVLKRVFGTEACFVSVGGIDAGPLRSTYSEGSPGALIAVLNSWDRVEAAVREGRAADLFPGRGAEEIRFELRQP